MINPKRTKWIGMWYAWDRWEMHTNFGQEAWRKANHFGDLTIQTVQQNKKTCSYNLQTWAQLHHCTLIEDTTYSEVISPTLTLDLSSLEWTTSAAVERAMMAPTVWYSVLYSGAHQLWYSKQWWVPPAVLSTIQWTLSTVAQQQWRLQPVVLNPIEWTSSTVARAMMTPTCSSQSCRVDFIDCGTGNDDTHLQ